MRQVKQLSSVSSQQSVSMENNLFFGGIRSGVKLTQHVICNIAGGEISLCGSKLTALHNDPPARAPVRLWLARYLFHMRTLMHI